MEMMNSHIYKTGKGMASIGKKIMEEEGLRLSFIKVIPPDVKFPSKQERDDPPVRLFMPWLDMSSSFSRRWNILG